MIGFLSGTIKTVNTHQIILLVGGVGYVVEMSAVDLARAQLGAAAEVFCYTHVREDALQIFGFFDQTAREFFEVLLSVSGVGPKSALQILAAGEINELRAAIERADAAALTALPGIGKKTAERIIVELRGKISDMLAVEGAARGAPEQEAAAALCGLGYRPDEARAAVRGLTGSVEEIIKQSLRHLKK